MLVISHGFLAFYWTQVSVYLSGRRQKELWAFRRPFSKLLMWWWETYSRALKTLIQLGISFRVRPSPSRSLQGNTGIQAVLPIINGLSQDVKVHNFALFPTAAGYSCLGCALPLIRLSHLGLISLPP